MTTSSMPGKNQNLMVLLLQILILLFNPPLIMPPSKLPTDHLWNPKRQGNWFLKLPEIARNFAYRTTSLELLGEDIATYFQAWQNKQPWAIDGLSKDKPVARPTIPNDATRFFKEDKTPLMQKNEGYLAALTGGLLQLYPEIATLSPQWAWLKKERSDFLRKAFWGNPATQGQLEATWGGNIQPHILKAALEITPVNDYKFIPDSSNANDTRQHAKILGWRLATILMLIRTPSLPPSSDLGTAKLPDSSSPNHQTLVKALCLVKYDDDFLQTRTTLNLRKSLKHLESQARNQAGKTPHYICALTSDLFGAFAYLWGATAASSQPEHKPALRLPIRDPHYMATLVSMTTIHFGHDAAQSPKCLTYNLNEVYKRLNAALTNEVKEAKWHGDCTVQALCQPTIAQIKLVLAKVQPLKLLQNLIEPVRDFEQSMLGLFQLALATRPEKIDDSILNAHPHLNISWRFTPENLTNAVKIVHVALTAARTNSPITEKTSDVENDINALRLCQRIAQSFSILRPTWQLIDVQTIVDTYHDQIYQQRASPEFQHARGTAAFVFICALLPQLLADDYEKTTSMLNSLGQAWNQTPPALKAIIINATLTAQVVKKLPVMVTATSTTGRRRL